jgi:hypothetical protein
MAFNQDTFAPVAPNSTNAPAFWTYTTTDLMEEVLLADYFANKKFQLEAGDFIYVKASDRATVLEYVGVGQPAKATAPADPQTVLEGFDDTTQNAVSLDTPVQITYGPAQGTVDDPVSLDANGRITFNQTGIYNLNVVFNMGRIGPAGGVAQLFCRTEFNGVPFGRPVIAFIGAPDVTASRQFEGTARVKAGDYIESYFYRDSAGVNEGGLAAIPSTIGWDGAPSATVRVVKLHD